MRVVQISPSIGRGSGVASVAHHLEREWQAMGVETLRFTLADAHGGWIPVDRGGLRGRVVVLVRVVWFSTVGTVMARRMLRRHPDAVSICHNDALAGDVYVNHGIVHTAFAARGRRLWRTVRNPLHTFTGARDALRYASRRRHRVVVNLVASEEADLRATYPLVRLPSRVIGNGVDTDLYRPSVAGRRVGREALGVTDDELVVLFVGHEYERKGLPELVEAVVDGPATWHLVVVGGSPDLVAGLRATAAARRLGDRLHTLGPQPDPTPWLHAADVLAIPSAYESYGLVVLEALASGVPVVATPTGCAPDVVVDGETGWLCERDPRSIRRALGRVEGADRAAMGRAARSMGERHSWRVIAAQYLDLFAELTGEGAPPPRRVVHAVRSDAFAGVERYVAVLAAAQAGRGDEVTVIGGDPEAMARALPPSVRRAPARTTAEVARRLRRVARSRPHVVHAHMSAAELAVSMSLLRGSRVVATRHFAAPRGSHLLRRLALGLAAHRIREEIAVSAYVADRARPAEAAVIHPGVADRPDRPGAADRAPVVLVAQRLEREKDTATALRAFAASGLAAQGWLLQVAGDGALRDELSVLAEASGIGHRTQLLGRRDDLPDLMDRASVLLATRPDEAFGLSVVEAMASGLPVVASAAGGHLETVGGTPGAALFPPGDVAAAAALLRELAGDPTRRDAYGAALRERQRTHFSVAAQLSATDAVYARASAGRLPAPRRGGRDLVVVSLEPWDHVWRRNQHLLVGLLRRDADLRVLLVEPARDPLHDARSRRPPRPGRGLRRGPHLDGVDHDALWLLEPTKVLPRRLDPGQDRRWATGVQRAARRLGMPDPTLWVNDPQGAELLDLTGWPALYDITDDWLAADRDGATHARLLDQERRLLRQVGEVVVCSPGLQATKGAAAGASTPPTLLRNAVDTADHLRARPRPDDLPTGPTAVYVGTLHGDRLDVELCAATALVVAPARVVLVGPDALAAAERARLDRAGVLRLGSKDRRDVPGYLQHADVLLVPHVVDDFTDSLDPIKLYEYRAVGRPVVATPVAGFRQAAGPRLVVAEGPAFVRAVAALVPAADAFPHGVDATVPTWADRVEEMHQVLERVRPGADPSAATTPGRPVAEVPLPVRLEMGHHAVQHVAGRAGIDVLHVKGLALPASLRHPGRTATDVDVLVRPADADRLVGLLRGAGWQQLGRFATSSPFEHSATLCHEHWGHVDVHRLFPGIGRPPQEAFDLLWSRRSATDLAGRECAVPDDVAHALLLVLHAARNPQGGQPHHDLTHVRHHPDPGLLPAVRALARELDAEVAVAAADGELSAHVGRPDYDLWQAVSGRGGRLAEWRARIAAAPDPGARVRMAVRAPQVNTDHLAMLLGRRPTGPEVAAEFVRRARAGAAEVAPWRRGRR